MRSLSAPRLPGCVQGLVRECSWFLDCRVFGQWFFVGVGGCQFFGRGLAIYADGLAFLSGSLKAIEYLAADLFSGPNRTSK